MMPHDVKGLLLEVGDAVLLRGRVISVQTSEEFCNVQFETDEKMYPGENKSSFYVNAKQLEKVTN